MITKWTGVVWKYLPRIVRRRIVRLTQANFTVSAAAVITNPEGEVLLLNHVIRLESGWGLPGGFMEHGEQPEEGIRREIREETGIEMNNLRLFQVRTIGSHLEMIFRAESDGKPEILSSEITELGWFAGANMPAKMNRPQKALIQKVLKEDV